MSTPLSDDVKALVRGANFAHLSTLMADGSPQVAPVWVDLEGDRVLIGTGEGRALLYRLPVGKGQLIYLGWEIAASLPNGRKPSTVADEHMFEEQVGILTSLTAELYPQR